MSAQLSLVYKPSYSGHEAWELQLETLRAAVNHLGLKEVAFELDVSRSTLSDSLSERDRKRWAAEWTHVVKAMLTARRDSVSANLLRAIAEADLAAAPAFTIEESADLVAEQVAAGYASADEGTKRAIAKLLAGGRR